MKKRADSNEIMDLPFKQTPAFIEAKKRKLDTSGTIDEIRYRLSRFVDEHSEMLETNRDRPQSTALLLPCHYRCRRLRRRHSIV